VCVQVIGGITCARSASGRTDAASLASVKVDPSWSVSETAVQPTTATAATVAAAAQAQVAGRSTRRCGASTVGSFASATASRRDTRGDTVHSPRSASPIAW
jgi:hypothetical protein